VEVVRQEKRQLLLGIGRRQLFGPDNTHAHNNKCRPQGRRTISAKAESSTETGTTLQRILSPPKDGTPY
jgi:hypothetical protein